MMDLRFAVLVLLLGGTLSFPTGDKTTNDEIPSKLQVDLQGLEARFEPVDQEDKVSEISGDNEDPIIGADVYAVEIESPVEGGDKESDLDPDEDANTQLIKVVGYETPHSRQKRSISTIFRIGRTGYNALRGWLAQRRMLSRVQSNRLRNNVREHFTKGNYDDAVKRYQDLGGKMKPFKNYATEGYSSKIGNRRFTVRKDSSSRGVPTLHSHKITDRGRKTGPIDKLRFMDE